MYPFFSIEGSILQHEVEIFRNEEYIYAEFSVKLITQIPEVTNLSYKEWTISEQH